MDICVARQPIFNRNKKVVGHELWHRSGLISNYGGTDGTDASLAVIRNTFVFLGQRIVPQPSQVFINLRRDLLLNGVFAGRLPITYVRMKRNKNLGYQDSQVSQVRHISLQLRIPTDG